MPHDIDVVIEAAAWEGFDLDTLAMRAADQTFDTLNLKGPFEVAVLACDDRRIASLNADFRGKAKPTNVLSWPSEELAQGQGRRPNPPNDPALGDIAIAWETCMAEAQSAKIPAKDHVSHLLVHGTLHLLGYDHETDADATLMEALEVQILGHLGIKNPYASETQHDETRG